MILIINVDDEFVKFHKKLTIIVKDENIEN